MTGVVGLQGIPDLVGHVINGAPFTVSRQERDAFDEVTWVNRAYPEPDAPEFPADILEGFHTLSLLDSVATLAIRFDPATTYSFNYGLDRVRFVEPVPIDVAIHSTFEIREVRAKGPGWLILRHCEFRIDGHDGPALVADWWLYVLPRTDIA